MQRRILIGALPALAIPRSFAQEADAAPATADKRKLVAVSLVGDELQVIDPPDATDGRSTPDAGRMVPAKGLDLDKQALVAVNEALDASPLRAVPRSFLLISDPELFHDQRNWFSSDRLTLPPKLAAAVAGEHATQLILVTKRRVDLDRVAATKGSTEIAIGAVTGNLGHGHVAGLGVYSYMGTGDAVSVTNGTAATRVDAPFASVDVSLVDLATGRVIAHRGTERTPAQKVDDKASLSVKLAAQLHRAVTDGVAAVLADS